MAALRDEIRAILREELAAVMAEASGVSVKTVRIETSDDLNAFARDLIGQMSNPKFAGKVKSACHRETMHGGIARLTQVNIIDIGL